MSTTESIAHTDQTPVVVTNEQPTDLDQALAQFTKDIEKEYAQEDLRTATAEVPAQLPQGDEAKAAPGPTDQLDPMVVSREVQLQIREEKLAAREREAEALRGRLAELEKKQVP